ncbi:MAG TPA: autotransporter-associated beta strand repeat-containing protein [Roseimicrobium sp.]|nr:autotransporter-associated beta strand repeat-containing protein [Roseimicrobium sp.]
MNTTASPLTPGCRWHTLSALLASVLLLASQSAYAANATWNGSSGTQAWATGANWLPAAAPGATTGTTNGDTATFNTSTVGTAITVDLNRNIAGITFDGNAGAYTIGSAGANGGNALLLSNSATAGFIQIASTFTGTGVTQTINAPLVFQGAGYTFNNNSSDSSNVLNFAGNITNAATSTLTLGGVNTGANTISGVISNGTGVQSITKVSTGSWTLAGNNTYTGGTRINNGTLRINGTLNGTTGTALTFGGVGDSGTAVFNQATNTSQGMGALLFNTGGEGTVQSIYAGTGSTALTFTTFQVNSTAAANFVVSGGANGTTNKIVLTNQALNSFLNQKTFFNGSNYVWNDAGGFVRGINYTSDTGAEAITAAQAAFTAGKLYEQISGAGAITGQTTQTITTLSIANASDFTLAGGATLTVNGILKSGGAAGGTISGGTGIQAANNIEMVIRTDQAADTLSISATILANGTSSLTKSGAGTLTLSGNNTYTGQTTVLGGTLNLNGNNTGTGALVVGTGATANLNGTNAYTGVTAISGGTVNANVAGAIGTGGGSAIAVSSGAAGINSTLTASAINAITGTSSLSFGGAGTNTINLLKANNFTGSISFGNNAAGNMLNLADFNAIASSSGISGSAGTINLLSNSAGTFNTLSSFSFATGAGMTINVANNGSGFGNALQFGNSSSTVAITSNRVLNITGANGYSLILPNVSITTSGGTLNPTTASVSVGNIVNLDSTGTVPINLGGSSTGNAVTGVIGNGAGTAITAVNKSGTSSWKLSGANTYTGKTTISGGTLQFAKTASLYNGATGSWTAANITAASGATLAVNVGGTGEFSATDVNTLLANISAVSASAGLQAGSRIGFDTTNASSGTFTQGNAIANSTGTGGGAIGLTKLGTGILVLDKANTYTGTTTVSEGTLAMGANNAFAATAFNFNGGTFAVGTFTNTAVGTLSLTANSAITLGAGGTFAFADSHLLDWGSYTLSITGTFVDGSSIRFGSNGSALTATQLGLISINGAGAALNSSGFLVSAVPEPSTYALLGGAGALFGACWFRRGNRRA